MTPCRMFTHAPSRFCLAAALCLLSAATTPALGQTPLTPIIGVGSPELDFGTVAIGSPLYLNESLFNAVPDSTSILHVTDVLIEGDAFSLYNPPDSTAVPGGTTVLVPVRFLPLGHGLAVGRVTIIAPDAPNSPLSVPLSGTGVADSLLFQMGVDDQGLPIHCGTGSSPQLRDTPSIRSYEMLPCVIRDVPEDFFVVEINTGGPVTAVTITTSGTSTSLIAPTYPSHSLRDDGQGYDRMAGDFVFTSDAFRYRLGQPIGHFRGDPESPDGLNFAYVGGAFLIEEVDHTIWEFTIRPTVALLRSDIPLATITSHTPTLASTDHLVNVRTSGRVVQSKLRLLPADISTITNAIYAEYPDAADFLTFFSTDVIERDDHAWWGVAGLHNLVKVNYTGTGLSMIDNSASYGSAGRLLGLTFHDHALRGVYSNNMVHEWTHQWEAHISSSFDLKQDGSHWKNRSNIASPVGGYLWVDNGDGTFTIDTSEGLVGGHHTSVMGQYMMGLIEGSQVHTFYVDDDLVPPFNGHVVQPGDIDVTVEIEDIQAVHGVRSPGPASAPRDFTIGCVIESHDRILSQVEATFYETLVAYMTQAVPPQQPDPYVGENWVSVARFWPGATWRAAFPVQDAIGETDVGSPDVLLTVPVPSVTETFTDIQCLLPQSGELRLRIYDVAGRLVREFHRVAQSPGRVTIRWDGESAQGTRVPSGVYFYRLDAGLMNASHPIVVVR